MIIIYSSRNLICIAHKYRETLFCCHACWAAGRLLLYAVKPRIAHRCIRSLSRVREPWHEHRKFSKPHRHEFQSSLNMNACAVLTEIDGRRLLFPPIPNEGCALTLNQSIFTTGERTSAGPREHRWACSAVQDRFSLPCHFFFRDRFSLKPACSAYLKSGLFGFFFQSK